MRPSQVLRVLRAMCVVSASEEDFSRNPPVYLWGPPGSAKSSLVKQVAAEAGIDLIDLRAVLLDPVDLRGLPKVNKSSVDWIPPGFLPRKGRGILFLDELAQAAPLVQSACLALTLDRRLGEYELPSGWSVVAASNRQEDRAGTHRLISPLLNRFVHLDVEVSAEDWQGWASTAGIRQEVRSFLRWKPELLHSFDPSKNERAFPTPRSWVFLSAVMTSVPDRDLLMTLAAGTVGEGAAGEFISYLRCYSLLPDIDFVLAHPEKVSVPEEPSVVYAQVGQLVERAREERTTAADVDAIVRYVERLPPEFAVLVARELYTLQRARGCRRLIQWLTEHKDLVI